MQDVAVSCSSMTKDYVSGTTVTHALRGIDLEVRAGELFMLVGPSGCGKTTLISVIAGILHHNQGNCTVLGSDLSRLSEDEKTKFRGANIGFVFQAYNLIPTLTARENVAVPLLISGLERSKAFQRADELLIRMGLEDKLNTLPGELSGGQQQRVAIARALIHQPRLIVCDEPTSSLDQDTGHRIMELFREFALSDNRSLIVVTHDARIFSFADRIGKMNDGLIERVVSSPQELH